MPFAPLTWPPGGLPLATTSRPPTGATPRRLLAACAALLLPAASHAAGGHHAVDDAAILDAGECQIETWVERQGGDQLLHIGPSCRLLGVEAGLHVDRNRAAHQQAPGVAGVQLKWARELQPGLAVGALWSADWQHGSPGQASRVLLLPLTWQPHATLALHLNIGREFRPHAPDKARHGVALEWQPSEQWQLLAEQWRDAVERQRRLGLRFVATERLSLDVSRATSLDAPRPARWAFGVNWGFGR